MKIADFVAMTFRQRIALLIVIVALAVVVTISFVVEHINRAQSELAEQIDAQKIEEFKSDIEKSGIDTTKKRQKRQKSPKKRDEYKDNSRRPIDTF